MPAEVLWVRPSAKADLESIHAIYANAVRNGSSSFELEPPGRQELARRRDEVLSRGLPWLVAEQGGRVLGYAYASLFRPRPAYRFALEDSIYLSREAQGQGIGRALLAELLARCQGTGARQMLAVIGDSGSLGSIGLHRALGFQHCGTLPAVGWKFGRWLDVVLMQRALGAGQGQAPHDPAT